MASTFRIHPALGIARVGDANGPGFIGPEFPGVPANWNFETGTFDDFKAGGRIKRQGVRFRVFEVDEDGSIVGEALPGQRGVTAIEWTVHVANRKASFFQFDGSNGDDGDFSKNGARNSNITGSSRLTLEIDPGPVSVVGLSASVVVLANPNPNTNKTITDLGDISTDEKGRLVFFGGHGKTLQSHDAPEIDDYVNNDGWLDDVSDGPVTAVIRCEDGSSSEALGAWVSVAPPDFAPSIGNVVSLYETMWDAVVRDRTIPIPNIGLYSSGGPLARLKQQRDDWDPEANRFKSYEPSYVGDIAWLFQRAFAAMLVHDPQDIKKAFHNPIGPQMWADLGDPDPEKDVLRQDIFKRVRNPTATDPADSRQMPRGLGDQYCDEDENPVGSAERANPRRFFSLTRTQYAMLVQWSTRRFVADGTAPPSIPTSKPDVTPEGLDRAVLENCVGGPFFPGIEVSWTIRNPLIYAEPFRLRPGARVGNGDPAVGIPDVVVCPGFLTQQMALPWQADFRDCAREPITNTATGAGAFAMWWAAQRPDDVFREEDPVHQVPWTRPPNFKVSDKDPKRFREMVTHWSTLGFVSRQDPRDKRRWLETERSA